MDYQQTIDYLFGQLPVFQVIGAGAYKPGLQTAWTLSHAFGDPHDSFATIHVAGTNGKGSTSHMLASVLMEAGYKVGLYTSPHIFDFRERIRVNGEKISESAVVDFVARYQLIRHESLSDVSPSFFELTTIMAFDYFRSQAVDIAVIETGLGGRLDTTNIITPLVSVITNVSLDHTALLGDTIAQIAYEKAGIIKPGVPVVIGEVSDESRRVYQDKAGSVGAPIIFAEDDPCDLSDIVCDLTGDFQKKNLNTVLTALRILDKADDDAVRRGLAHVVDNTHLLGRWTPLQHNGRHLILDTGHNPGAWNYLAPALTDMASRQRLWIVLGFSNDKDVSSIFDMLPTNAEYCFVQPSVKRGRPAKELLTLARERGIEAVAFDSVSEGIDYVYQHSCQGDTIFVGGSNFVVADLPFRP